MLDRPLAEADQDGSAPRRAPRWPLAVVAAAGLLGAAGVVIGAAGAHGSGGDLARTASTFLLIHAAVLVAGAGVGFALPRRSLLLIAALALLWIGAALFGGELAFAALLAWRPVPLAAPAGGLCLIAGWLCLSVSALFAGLR